MWCVPHRGSCADSSPRTPLIHCVRESYSRQPSVNPARINPARINPTRINPARVNPARVNPARVNPARVNPNLRRTCPVALSLASSLQCTCASDATCAATATATVRRTTASTRTKFTAVRVPTPSSPLSSIPQEGKNVPNIRVTQCHTGLETPVAKLGMLCCHSSTRWSLPPHSHHTARSHTDASYRGQECVADASPRRVPTPTSALVFV